MPGGRVTSEMTGIGTTGRGRHERIAAMLAMFETTRLLLRAVSLDDVEKLVALDGDPAVMRYINGGRASLPVEVEAVVRNSIGHRWVAFERSSIEFLGWFALDPSGGAGRDLELGYRLRREAWGGGYASEVRWPSSSPHSPRWGPIVYGRRR